MKPVLVAAAALALWAAADAHAATPFTAGDGSSPAVAVGADGAGHVVWTLTGADDDLGYCRVSAGAEACNRTATLDFGATNAGSTGRARVFTPAPGKVVVVAGCTQCPSGDITNKIFRWTSTNGGDSFSGPTLTGTAAEMNGAGTWLDDLGIYVNSNGSRAKAMNAALAGDGVGYVSGGFVYGPEVARATGNKLVGAASDLGTVRFGVYTAGTGTVTAMNTPANWLTDQPLPGAEPNIDTPSLSSGPNGVVLAYTQAVIGDPHVAVRRFDAGANTFGPPTYVEGDDPIETDTGYADSAQDAAGRLHLVWRSLHDGGRLRYRASDPSGTVWGGVGTLAAHEGFIEPELAAGPDGRGFVAWTPSTAGAIRVVPLDPQPESGLAPPPSPGATTTSPGTATPPPVLRPPARRPGPAASAGAGRTYTGPARSRSTSVAGGSVSFGVPGTCVNPGQRFTVTLKWKRKKRKGTKFVKVTRTDFYVAKRRVRIDRKAPFRHTMTVVASTRRGSTITLRARAFIKVRRGKGPKKSIRATVRVCG